MTTTRERALEAALKSLLQDHAGFCRQAGVDPDKNTRAQAAWSALALPPSPQPPPVAPGHTDLMVSPESLDAWLKETPDLSRFATELQNIEDCALAWAAEDNDKGADMPKGWAAVFRLARAAPDMLAALTAIEKECALNHETGKATFWTYTGADRAIELVRAAIASATGREG